jgi:hypothetical protein
MSAEATQDKRDKRDDELERKIADAVKFGVPIATALLAIMAGMFIDVSTAILVLAAGALVGVIAMFWSSLRALLGETPLSGADAYAFGAPPRAEEEQKRAVVRALKDLEFERSVGKISDDDYNVLVAKYRAEAKRLLQLLDEDAVPRREKAEALVLRRLRQEGLLETDETDESDETNDDETAEEASERDEAPKKAADDADDADDADEPEETSKAKEEEPKATKKAAAEEPARKPKKKKKTAKKAARATTAEPGDDTKESPCAACSATNDEDALFCKKCGARLKAPEAESKRSETDEEADAS